MEDSASIALSRDSANPISSSGKIGSRKKLDLELASSFLRALQRSRSRTRRNNLEFFSRSSRICSISEWSLSRCWNASSVPEKASAKASAEAEAMSALTLRLVDVDCCSSCCWLRFSLFSSRDLRLAHRSPVVFSMSRGSGGGVGSFSVGSKRRFRLRTRGDLVLLLRGCRRFCFVVDWAWGPGLEELMVPLLDIVVRMDSLVV